MPPSEVASGSVRSARSSGRTAESDKSVPGPKYG
jgi:hypothetical protein